MCAPAKSRQITVQDGGLQTELSGTCRVGVVLLLESQRSPGTWSVANVLFFSKPSVERIKSSLFVSGQESSTHSLSCPKAPLTAPLSPVRHPGHQHIPWAVMLV